MNLEEARQESSISSSNLPIPPDVVVRKPAILAFPRTPAMEARQRLKVGGKVILVVNDEGFQEYKYLFPDGHLGAVED